MLKRAYIALGSNMGNGANNLKQSIEALGLVPGVSVTRVSEFYVTEPWGFRDQPDFTNACCEVETSLSPEALLGVCLGIEAGFGRIREFKNGPRIIDLDLLMYEGETRDTPELRLPHPGMKTRSFVLEPLNDLAENGYVLDLDVKSALESLNIG